MNFDHLLKASLPRAWFGLKRFKYKHLGRGEAELHLVRHFIEPRSTSLDVGSSIGLYAAEMARHADKVIAFEANPAIAAFARRVAAANVQVINTALSSAPGRCTLSMPVSRKGHPVTELASLAKREAGDAETITIEVETKRLDDFPIANCSFIKVDVEGHEEALLDGANALIAAQRPALMIELVEAFNPGVVARLAQRFAALSYDCIFFTDGKPQPVSQFDAARDQAAELLAASSPDYVNNFFFIPAERRARVLARLS